eukprot:1854931-Rhodomonas_salina.1
MLPAFIHSSLRSCRQTLIPITTLCAGHARPNSDAGSTKRELLCRPESQLPSAALSAGTTAACGVPSAASPVCCRLASRSIEPERCARTQGRYHHASAPQLF